MPDSCDLILCGGRGGGRSTASFLLALRTAQEGKEVAFISPDFRESEQVKQCISDTLESIYSAIGGDQFRAFYQLPVNPDKSCLSRISYYEYNLPRSEGHKYLAIVRNNVPIPEHHLGRIVVDGGSDRVEHYSHRPWRMWAWCPSTYKDNPYLPSDYTDRLWQAADGDTALYKSWTAGTW
jgi:hypothetical protein